MVSNYSKILLRSMSKVAKEIPQSLPHRPPSTFYPTVVLTDGSTIKMRSTAPKGIILLTKDTRNHALWNPDTLSENDRSSDTLTKFAQKYEGLDTFGLEEDGFDFFDNVGEHGNKSMHVTNKDLTFLSSKKTSKK